MTQVTYLCIYIFIVLHNNKKNNINARGTKLYVNVVESVPDINTRRPRTILLLPPCPLEERLATSSGYICLLMSRL